MKKISDLPPDTNIQDFAVRLPENIYKFSSLPMYGIKNIPVYLQGWVSGDFFVKISKTSSQIYPMFWMLIPSNIDEWEVVE